MKLFRRGMYWGVGFSVMPRMLFFQSKTSQKEEESENGKGGNYGSREERLSA